MYIFNLSRKKKNALAGYGFLIPGLLVLLVFMGYPLIHSFYLSFTEYNFAYDKTPTFVAFNNFVSMFSDPTFRTSLRNTAVFSAVFFPSIMVLSLCLAVLLDYGVRGSNIFRTCIFIPMVVPLSLSGIIFQWLLQNNFGLINSFLRQMGLGFLARDWLGDGKLAMGCVVAVSIWKYMGMMVIFFLTGLNSISRDIIEAATVDGATQWQKIMKIILPNLKETYVVAGIWAIIQSIKVYEQSYIMTQGGPGTSTLVLYQYTWTQSFGYYEMGYGAAMAYFVGFVIMIFSALNLYVNRSKD